MTSGNQLLTVDAQSGITRVTLVERNILEEGVIQQIGQQLLEVIDRDITPKLLIDFQKVDHLSSAALGMLITVHHRVRDKAGQLRLCGIAPQIYEVFQITRLNKVFQIYDHSDEAIQSFR